MHKFFAKTQFLGKKVLFLSQCHSTNDIAAGLLKEKKQLEGTTVITADQTNGRGQRGNTWESEPNKNATFSLILKPTIIPAQHQFQLHIITTLAIHATLFPLLGKELKIKWPNDIYYGDQKLGGILIENTLKGQHIETAIIGIGLNVNQIQFHTSSATSLQEITGETYNVNELIEQLLIELEKKYLALKGNELKNLEFQYLRRLYRFETDSLYETAGRPFHGKITGINPLGLLQIQENEMRHEFAFKEVKYL
ncbi:biotin--[acetyl-CoA-carboxylase] ligase [Reichenbachiella carrageenanivorans]|uniref:Biotin--[acetyl-CoA-carboxylase] ligase n=1 Tax=Reichenbachiella carrageenanivorans TaxID=2979869 RepID=A0ABY6D247_9BACT|nr:biotin--[acetyl-CoA-carboxylase] ligase [Reichenbachiella carrageenanivorans]UXX79989.1 biotin--[acetyl-CoA-carboxylase] ligase [Reichenbachiella carrageenanivorans]